MGITYSGDGKITISGQAIGTDRDDSSEPEWAKRLSQRARELSNDENVNDGVVNTGSGSVTVTNSTVAGRFVRSRKF
jgi:hypothetical protein